MGTWASFLGHFSRLSHKLRWTFLVSLNVELEHELAFSATPYWPRSRWEGDWDDDMYEAWKRQLFEAGSWNKVRGPAGAVYCRWK